MNNSLHMQDIEILAGSRETVAAALAALNALPVDEERPAPASAVRQTFQTTLARSFSVTGPGTYRAGVPSTLEFRPGTRPGWWFDRTDLCGQLPICVSIQNVLSANRNITLHSGAPENFIRMTEHIIAQKLGMNLDCVEIRMSSFDPPLFDDGSFPIADGILKAGLSQTSFPLKYVTVPHPVAIQNQRGGTLLFLPADNASNPILTLDTGIDFPSAIGRQRIRFDLTPETFSYGSHARTNAPLSDILLVKSIGKFSPFWRHIGYTRENILITRKNRYVNQPGFPKNGKYLEAVWHRACEDLVAALSLLDGMRLCGTIFSYKAGHQLDVDFVTALVRNNLLMEF